MREPLERTAELARSVGTELILLRLEPKPCMSTICVHCEFCDTVRNSMRYGSTVRDYSRLAQYAGNRNPICHIYRSEEGVTRTASAKNKSGLFPRFQISLFHGFMTACSVV